uniref:Uncharacterized protein n=1 Tax=Arundo donax TaxID=35708 RepID=A0A0A8YDA0_ARUDO
MLNLNGMVISTFGHSYLQSYMLIKTYKYRTSLLLPKTASDLFFSLSLIWAVMRCVCVYYPKIM